MEPSLQSDWQCPENQASILGDTHSKGESRAERRNAYAAFEGNPHVEVMSSTPQWLHLRMLPDLSAIDEVERFICLDFAGLPEQLAANLGIALRELLENASEHGCSFDCSQNVDFRYMRTERLVQFQIRDSGPGFSFDAIDHAALNNPPGHPLKACRVSVRSRHASRRIRHLPR